jgi:hypothetical protein
LGHEAAEGCQSWGMMQPLGRERDGGGERERGRRCRRVKERIWACGVLNAQTPVTKRMPNLICGISIFCLQTKSLLPLRTVILLNSLFVIISETCRPTSHRESCNGKYGID